MSEDSTDSLKAEIRKLRGKNSELMQAARSGHAALQRVRDIEAGGHVHLGAIASSMLSASLKQLSSVLVSEQPPKARETSFEPDA